MKNAVLIILLLVSVRWVSAQDTVYIDKNYRWCNKADAIEYAVCYQDSTPKVVYFYDMQGQPISISHYEVYEKEWRIRNGKAILLYPSGKICKINFWKMNRLDGEQTAYYENGQIKEVEIYENDKFLSGKYYNEEGNEIPFSDIYRPAQYPGGEQELIKFVKGQLCHPKKSFSKGIEGRVIITLHLDESGYITGYEIKRRAEEDMVEEAVRVVKKLMKRSRKEPWTPFKKEGKPLKGVTNLPIVFALPY